jgi:nucleotide-binding universal stress UspA family protein
VGKDCVVEWEAVAYSRGVKTILAPVDFSDVSEAVVAEASRLAKALGGRVVLLTVIQPPVITNEYAPLMENIAEITAAGEKAASKRLASIQERLEAQSLSVEVVQLNGAPVTQIADQAAKLRADYVVMGSHGHTAFYDLLVGSTTHGVLMRATCPVVIVPAQTTKKASQAR